MEKRELGKSGIAIAPLVFGGNVFGWTTDRQQSFTLLDRFTGQGFNAIDTADVYSSWAPGLSGGESETVIGEWLAQGGRRDDVVLMTKVGMWESRKGLSAANIEAALDDSLRRLQTDHVDVYFAHVDDESVPFEETLGAFSRLIEAGKVRAIGASNHSADRLQAALDAAKAAGLPRYEMVQPAYNLHDRKDFEQSLLPVIQSERLGAVSYFSLASGFLSGKYRTKADLEGSSRKGFLEGYFDDRGARILTALREVAEGVGAPQAQVALAWLMSRPGLTAPIASATSVQQLDEIMGAVALDLPTEARERLDAASR
ncbi:aldo/keto reductase [Paracoccus sp. MC1862]|uniref:aldo/keto reductase n=1 Tax=Paracoccus sp. MC1862 TaxID=2760307 RepID=UPI0016026F58|nr:aldo/keto reductase [Paracoccus sp. MC1862]MBB1498348.1 aldo/keto reductase [Paracoccus sp. MC1862]QQO44896.1 aldo/keto reductase [Paracoccus sp. MC1862]